MPTEATQRAAAPRSAPHPAPAGGAAKTAIVVGASSGIGEALVEELLFEGWRVVAIARRAELLDALRKRFETRRTPGAELFVHVHDVVDAQDVPELFERCARELGGVELVIYAAAVMPKIARDEYDTEKDLSQVHVNVGGCIAWCNQAAMFLSKQRRGTIVGISSIAGERGRKGNPVYNATKAAMNTYLEAIRNRLAESNVHVCTVKPGFVDTAMTQGMSGLLWLVSANDAARMILAAARSKANERFVPRRWALVAFVIRSIPSFLFKKMNV